MAPIVLALSCAVISAGPAVANHPRVIVIGLDATSFNVLDPLIEAKITPNLEAIATNGRGELTSIWPLRTPQVWTTMVTGKYPGQHRIWDHVSNSRYNPPRFRTKEKRTLTTKHRQSQAIWNIFDRQGIAVLSVGWIATWPAETLEHGIMAAPIVLTNADRQVSIKGTFWRDAKRQLHPPQLWEKAKPLIVEGADLTSEDIDPFADLPPDEHSIWKLPYMPRYRKALKWSVARAKTVENLTIELFPAAQPDLTLIYFQCGDSLLHRFWVFQKSVEEIVERLDTHDIPTQHAAELHERFGRVVQACYQDIDQRVGRILEMARGDDALVLVVSDHGFGEAPFPHPKRTEPYGGNHRDAGVILASAPWIPKGTVIKDATVLDLMPTLLHLFGQPIAKDMPGKIIQPLLPPAAAQIKPRRIPSYEKKPQTKIPFRHGWPTRKYRPLAEDS